MEGNYFVNQFLLQTIFKLNEINLHQAFSVFLKQANPTSNIISSKHFEVYIINRASSIRKILLSNFRFLNDVKFKLLIWEITKNLVSFNLHSFRYLITVCKWIKKIVRFFNEILSTNRRSKRQHLEWFFVKWKNSNAMKFNCINRDFQLIFTL